MSEIKYNEDVLDNEFEEDLVEGELSEDDILEDDTLEGSAGFIVNSDFIPDALELKNVVETWNRRNEGIVENYGNAKIVYEQKLTRNRTRRKVRFFRRTYRFGLVVFLLGIVFAVLRGTVFKDAGIPLIAVIGVFALALIMIVCGYCLRKHFRKKVKELNAVLSEKKNIYYEEQKNIFVIEDEAKEYFIRYGIKCPNRIVPDVLQTLMERCGLSIPIVEIPHRPVVQKVEGKI